MRLGFYFSYTKRPVPIWVVVFFCLIAVNLLTAATAKSAACDTTKITNHFELIFEGVTYNESLGTSEWDYSLTWDGRPPALSYFFIELCSLLTNDNLVAVEPDFGTIGFNGNAKLYGIKWDDINNFPADTSINFSFTLDQLLQVDHTQFAPKAGVNQNLATICGPSLICDTVTNPCLGNIPPTAICPNDTTIIVNQLNEICLSGFEGFDSDGDLESIIALGGSWDSGVVCFVPAEGSNFITLIVTDSCGLADTCTTLVSVITNNPPVCTLPPDSSTISLCPGQSSCLVIGAEDPDNNLVGCSIIDGPGAIVDDTLWCYTPQGNETVTVTIQCVDSLGLECTGTFTVEFIVPETPITVSADTAVAYLCSFGESFCVPLTINNSGESFEVISQNGTFNSDDSTICMPADTTGRYCNQVIVINNCGQADTVEYCIDVFINSAPVAVCPEIEPIFVCDIDDEICISGFEFLDIDQNIASVEVFGGVLNGDTVCLVPTVGENVITLIVTDSCGLTDTCRAIINVLGTNGPQIIIAMPDTSIYLCQPDYVCLPMVFADSQNNITSISVNLGTYADGQVCFVPYDSGTYTIIATATDSCGAVTSDTAYVQIITDQYVNLQCPNDTTIFQCTLDTLCFPIGDIPEWAQINVSGINTRYDEQTHEVCFYVECGVQNRIVVKAITDCDTISCEFTVDVQCNQPPVVFLPQDTTISLCQPDSVYLPVGISDPDGNLFGVNFDSWVNYQPVTGKLSFYADTSGTYLVTVTAYDSCDLVTVRQVAVTVLLNTPPICVVPNDTSFFLCEPTKISRPVYGIDDSQIEPICSVVSGPGEIIDGYWNYQASTSAELKIVIKCVDECNRICRDSFFVSISVNEAPICELPNDTTISQCVPTEICLPISAQDTDGNLVGCTLISGPGSVSNKTGKMPGGKEATASTSTNDWCYSPTQDTSFVVVILCEDSCGAFCIDSFTVTIDLNEAPIVLCPGDTSLFMCGLEETYLTGFSASDPNGDDLTVSLTGGTLLGDTAMFTPQVGENKLILTAFDSCGLTIACTTSVFVDTNSAPVCQLPNDTTITGCVSDQVCLPVSAIDVDENLLGCELVGGPGTLENGFWCYSSQSNDTVTVTIRCTDECGEFCEDSFTVIFEVGSAPFIEDQYFAFKYCSDVISRELYIEAGNSTEDPTKFSLVSGIDSIDSLSGIISYLPDTPGVYSFVVSASNSCGSNTATIYDTITINRAPVIFGFDSTVYLCATEDVCFQLSCSDPDNDSLEIQLIQGPGQFTQLSPTSGQTCFFPEKIDSATYLFVFQVTDLCSLDGRGQYDYYYDTVTITVILNQNPTLSIPLSLNLFACNQDTVCFPISASDPEGDPMTIEILSGNAIVNGDSAICISIDTAGAYEFMVRVSDSCGNSSTYESTIHVDVNTPPQVSLGQDSTVTGCTGGQVCFGINVTDSDNNLSDVLANFGTVYGTDSVCFNADTSGDYMIVVTVIDSCGAQDLDSININVDLNEPPIVSLGEDFSKEVCGGDSICFSYLVSDDNLLGAYSNASITNGNVCFYVDTAGQYAIWVRAIDSCEVAAEDTIVVTVTIPPAPFVEIGDDLRAIICESTEFCIDVETIENYASIEFNRVGYNPDTRQFCFTADQFILDLLTVTVTDSCGNTAYDSLPVYIQFNTAPEVEVAMRDTTVYLCQPSYVCLPVLFADSQNNISNISVNRGTYENGQVCFVPYDSGTYTIIATATDSCGAVVSDTAYVSVLTDQSVDLQCPNDTTVFQCSLDTLCFPIGDIPDWAQIQVSGINTWYNPQTQEVCFYVSCGVRNRIVVKAITPCDTLSCSFTVDVRCNQPPVVILPQDTSITQCAFDSVRIPVGITDANGNLASISTDSWVNYQPVTGKLSFLPDSQGVYVIQVTATDSCDVSDSEDIVVNVRLNRKPEISFAPFDTVFSLCTPLEICLPITVDDSDGNISQVTPSIGYYDADSQRVCFTPTDSFGVYCVTVIVTDICGLADTAYQCITINSDGIVDIECPTAPIYDTLCFADSVCTQLAIVGQSDSITTSLGRIVDGNLCFFADTTGIYDIDVTLFSACTTLTCQVTFDITVFELTTVICPPSNTALVCGPDTLFYQFNSVSATSFSITPPAFVVGDSIGLPVLESGVFNLTLVGMGICGVDSCSFTVDATINSAPVVVSIPDTTVTNCGLAEFCVPFTVTDVDSNVDSIVGPNGLITGNEYCFTPPTAGEYRVIISAYDSCGEVGADTTYVRFVIAQADIICPGAQSKTVCRGDSVRVVVPITPFEAVVSVFLNGELNGFYNRDSALIIVFPTIPGSQTITVVAEAGCAVDSCVIPLTVNFLELTGITCPGVIDTFLCPLEINSICFPISVVGTNVQVSVNNGATYANGLICVPVSQEGTINVRIIAIGGCGVDTCITVINIDADDPPLLYLPADTVIEMCDFDVSEICIGGIYAVDDSDVTVTQICGPGTFQLITNDSGALCFTPSGIIYGTYTFCFEAGDGCNSQIDSFTVNIVEGPECNMCAVVSIDGGECVPVGRQQRVTINIETFQPIGGFDLLINYDPTVTSFQAAQIAGTAIEGWEYFTYRLNQGSCGAACPPGLIRFLGIADINNGAAHPPTNTLSPVGALIHIFFQISSDQNLGGLFLPIRFVTYDCQDNAFSDLSGNNLFIDSKIFNSENILIWDESNDISFPESIRPTGLGTSDSCIDESAKVIPKRCIDFINGGICVIHPDSIDDRGDINLNSIAYEVADVVVFTNYFIYGLSAFTVNVPGQIAASDVNADGITLSVADLVLMLRIIIGDIPPTPKINPHNIELQLANTFDENGMTVSEESVNGLGGAYLVYKFDNSALIGTPALTAASGHMDFQYHIENNELRLLIYSMNGGFIVSGKQEIVRIPFEGNQPLLVKSDFADADSRPYRTANMNAAVPEGFELHQNYPNPFNPSTTMSFSLPSQSDWNLTVYNVAGETVRRFKGADEAGAVNVIWDGRNDDGSEVASGVYFYRLEALDLVANKKMMLLK